MSFFYIFFMYIYYYILTTPLVLDPASVLPCRVREPRTEHLDRPQVVIAQRVTGGRSGLNRPGIDPESGQRAGRDSADFVRALCVFTIDVELR